MAVGVGGGNLRNNTARCKPSRRYCGNNERAKCVGNAADKTRTEGRKDLRELRGLVMTCPATLRRSAYAVSAANRKA